MSFASPARVSVSLLGVRDRQESEGALAFKYVFGRRFKRGGWKNFQQTSGLENPFVSLDTVLPADILTRKKKEWAGMRRMHITHVCLRHAIRPRWSSWWMISLSAVFASSSVQERDWMGASSNFSKSQSEPAASANSRSRARGLQKCVLFFPCRLDSLKFPFAEHTDVPEFYISNGARSKTDSSTCFWSYVYCICVSSDFTVSNMTYEETTRKIRWRRKKKKNNIKDIT